MIYSILWGSDVVGLPPAQLIKISRRKEIRSMRAQVSLIPTESKKLIAKAVARMDEIRYALKKGIVALHPSSSTIFIVEELIGKLPATEVWMEPAPQWSRGNSVPRTIP